MARPKITLYVDTVSPFAYEAYHVLRHNSVFQGCDVTYIPIFLGGLMHKCGNTAPIKIKNKDKWINIERLRWARAFSVPMTESLPPDFPAPTLPIMRALAVVAANPDRSRLTRALDTFFTRHWGPEAAATHKPEVLRETLEGLFGTDEAARIIAESQTTGKQALIANTDKAFEDGAFGLPWMVCTNAQGGTEGFWGVDHLAQVAQFLGLDLTKARGDGENPGWKSLL
ncbi:Glutathione S-transferase kappa 1 [Madurella mycetomatis]|uniref:Glutathione S-transferase kappa n=1 Tax=Madurella mycetomatis TaxID=100816 RepID=A0A175VQP3_9PEZI|nr:Glutathione S-transferase kappa 1 [Madurella mycetomatis]